MPWNIGKLCPFALPKEYMSIAIEIRGLVFKIWIQFLFRIFNTINKAPDVKSPSALVFQNLNSVFIRVLSIITKVPDANLPSTLVFQNLNSVFF